MTAKSTSRYGFIDTIRGVAALLVLVQHSLYESGLLGGTPNGFIPTSLELGETGVVAFFLVSGFVIPLSLEKTGRVGLFWIHRALRIYPLYLTVYCVGLVISAGGRIHSIGGAARNALAHLFFVQEYLREENFVGGSWTLSLELVWYIAVTSIFLTFVYKKTFLIVGLSVAVSVMAKVSCARWVHLPMGRLSMLICCVLGLLCYRYHKNDLSRRSFGLLSTLLVVTIGMNLLVGEELFPAVHPTATFKMAADSWMLAAVIFFLPFFSRRNAIWGHAAFRFLGRISYSVYLVHPIVLSLLSKAEVRGVTAIAATFAATIGISVLTYRWIESPPIRFGHSLKLPE